jgi:sugar phosphate isomerase/epimerase
MQIRGHDIGVCSWSMRGAEMRDVATKLKSVGLSHTQIATAPLVTMDAAKRSDELAALRDGGVSITAGMIGFPGEDYSTIAMIRKTGGYLPDEQWPERRDLTLRAAELMREIGVPLLSTHVGFVPTSSAAEYATIIERLRELADHLATMNVTLLMETGQETASELLQFLNDLARKNVQVNFDPANMILYGAGDPIDAIRILGRHIRHVHVKDAILSDQPRMKWGTEVPFGTGQVRPRRFLDALEAVGYTGPLIIEREAGDERLRDIRVAIDALQHAAA